MALQHRNLRARLLLIVFTSTVLIGSFTVALMSFVTYQNKLLDSKAQINQLMDAVEYSAAIASYVSNTEIANDVIKGLLRSENVCQARLYNRSGLDASAAKYPDSAACPEVITRILHSPFDDKEIVGRMETYLDSSVIKADAYHHAGQLALSLLALVLLPGLIIWLEVSRFITKPIQRLSEQLHRIAPGTNARISPVTNQAEDEIVQLVSDVNHLLDVVDTTLAEERKQRTLIENMERKYQHLAHHDMLTGLPNRSLFTDRLQQMLVHAKRDDLHCALIYLDLDKFKPVNDTLGHDIGDLLLKEVALRLLSVMRESDTVSRVGGDEFVVLLPAIESRQDALTVADKIIQALEQPYSISGHVLRLGSSLGIAIYPEHGTDEISLVKHADIAMYQSKQNGRNQVQVYRAGMLQESFN